MDVNVYPCRLAALYARYPVITVLINFAKWHQLNSKLAVMKWYSKNFQLIDKNERLFISLGQQSQQWLRHWNRIVAILTKFSSLAAKEVVIFINFRYSQWWKFCQNDDIYISVHGRLPHEINANFEKVICSRTFRWRPSLPFTNVDKLKSKHG